MGDLVKKELMQLTIWRESHKNGQINFPIGCPVLGNEDSVNELKESYKGMEGAYIFYAQQYNTIGMWKKTTQPALHIKKAAGYEHQDLHYAIYEHKIQDI